MQLQGVARIISKASDVSSLTGASLHGLTIGIRERWSQLFNTLQDMRTLDLRTDVWADDPDHRQVWADTSRIRELYELHGGHWETFQGIQLAYALLSGRIVGNNGVGEEPSALQFAGFETYEWQERVSARNDVTQVVRRVQAHAKRFVKAHSSSALAPILNFAIDDYRERRGLRPLKANLDTVSLWYAEQRGNHPS